MDGILLILFLFWLFKKLSQAAKAKGAPARPVQPEVRGAKAPQSPFSNAARPMSKRSPAAIQHEKRMRQLHEQADRIQRSTGVTVADTLEGMGSEGEVVYQPIQSRMVDIAMEPAYQGSLGGGSTEGEDVCDPTLEHARPNRDELESVYAEEIGAEPLMDFSAKAILQGVVMSEVFARPGQRKWGGR